MKVAENVGQQLHFASRAPDDAKASSGDLRRFTALALPVLGKLAKIDHPAITHHIVETADQLRALQPRRALLIAAQAVDHDNAYVREPLALDAIHLLIRHYLADHREIVLHDHEYISSMRTILEAFVRVGWDKAVELADELDDLFG